jgi:phosphatidylserine synthase
MDLIDGYFAVKFNQQTDFGKYADTLVDFFICCVIPVLMAYAFLEINIILACSFSFFLICGMWRLANYNVVASTEKQTHFTGLPVPGAMLFATMAIWGSAHHGLPAWLCIIVFFATGLLMVSSVKLEKYGFWQKALCIIGLAFLAGIVFT